MIVLLRVSFNDRLMVLMRVETGLHEYKDVV
jgi:hypothetical protein